MPLQAPPHKWLVIAIGWELLLFVVLIHTPSVRDAFGIDFSAGADYAMAPFVSALALVAIEAAKRALKGGDSAFNRRASMCPQLPGRREELRTRH